MSSACDSTKHFTVKSNIKVCFVKNTITNAIWSSGNINVCDHCGVNYKTSGIPGKKQQLGVAEYSSFVCCMPHPAGVTLWQMGADFYHRFSSFFVSEWKHILQVSYLWIGEIL